MEINPSMYRLVSRIIYIAAIIAAALAAFFYLRFLGAEMNWTRSTATVTEVISLPNDAAKQKITIQYPVNNETATETFTTDEFNSRSLHAGDTLVVLINPEDSSDRSLLESGPYMTRLALKTGAWALGLFMLGYFVSRRQS